MRTIVSRREQLARQLLPVLALVLTGCPGQELAPLSPCTVSAVSERVDQQGVSQLDLLFVVDNSGSMATEQQKLAEQLPRLVEVLTKGDKTPQLAAGDSNDKTRYFTPVSSLHLGVVSSNMGGIDEFPSNAGEALLSCRGLGDDGKLLHATTIARSETRAGRNEFQDYVQDELVLAALPECDIPMPPLYQVYEAGKAPSPDEVAKSFRCVSRLGVRGCPYEQQLEAMWKAVAPSDGADPLVHVFLNGSKGHGNPSGANQGFVRDNAVLAIIHVTDEEDCSIKQEGKALFEETPAADTRFGMAVNLRCGLHGEKEGLLWPETRYVEGLRSLKPDNPDRVIFAAIVGIPVEAIGKPIDEILARPDMQFQVASDNAILPEPSCRRRNNNKREEAYPPRRFLKVAKAFGEEAVIHSICTDDFAPALDRIIDRIADKLKGPCLPRKLTPDRNGLVRCSVYELLAPGETSCAPARGHTDEAPIARTFRQQGVNTERLTCKMEQVPVVGGVRGSGTGWYYDDFTSNLQTECPPGEQQRISFTFGELPPNTGATFECFQPVARIDANARGIEAVNTRCDASDVVCMGRNSESDDYELICMENTCQIGCEVDPDCPPGWVCDVGALSADMRKFCQQPTCQANEVASQAAEQNDGG